MAAESNEQHRQRLVDELWKLIQDSKSLVEETRRLAAEADAVRKKASNNPDPNSTEQPPHSPAE